MSSASATRTIPASSERGSPPGAVRDDRLEHLRGDHGQLRLLVDPLEQRADLGLDEEEAELLVALAVHGHADVVEERSERDDDLGVVVRHPEVAHGRGLDAVLRQLAEELQPDVRDDLDVHPGVVVDPHAHGRVHVRDVPPGLQPAVGVDALEQRAELPVRALGRVDAHRVDGLRGRQPRLALGLVRDRLVDPLLRLLVERHDRSVRSAPPVHRCVCARCSSGSGHGQSGSPRSAVRRRRRPSRRTGSCRARGGRGAPRASPARRCGRARARRSGRRRGSSTGGGR